MIYNQSNACNIITECFHVIFHWKVTRLCFRSQVEKLTQALEHKTKETEKLKKEMTVKDLQIENLRLQLEQVGLTDNNNPGSSEDRLSMMVAQLESLSTQVPEDIRRKLEHIASIGKQS